MEQIFQKMLEIESTITKPLKFTYFKALQALKRLLEQKLFKNPIKEDKY